MLNLETLKKLAADHCSKIWVHELREPVRCGEWIVVTEGHVLLAIRGAGDVAPFPARTEESLKKMLEKPLGDERRPLVELKEFVGPLELPKRCAICDSTGRIACAKCESSGEIDCECLDCGNEHTRECPFCHGEGGKKCPNACTNQIVRYGIIGEAVFDLNILAPFLGLVDAETYRAARFTGAEFIIGDDDWRIAVMPSRVERKDDMPRFELKVCP